jgi:hypothetical protein
VVIYIIRHYINCPELLDKKYLKIYLLIPMTIMQIYKISISVIESGFETAYNIIERKCSDERDYIT